MKFTDKFVDSFLHFQKKYALSITIIGIILSLFCYPRAVKLLGTIATELENLLPENYSTVSLNKDIKKKFNRRSSLSLIISSPSTQNNLKVALELKKFLESLAEVDFVENEKPGYDFFDKNKLLFLSLQDLYTVRDKLDDKIQKEKLGGLYIDLESDDEATATASGSKAITWDTLKERYQDFDSSKIQNRYLANKDGTVYVLKVYPKSTNTKLTFFESFGNLIQNKVSEFNPKHIVSDVEWGYAGAIITRVDEYHALMGDLKIAGIISGVAIFVALLIYFRNLVAALIIFVPMVSSTMFAFWFNSFFFQHLNVVTSFLFSIIFGLGVDIGIHMLTRYMQDRRAGMGVDHVHRKIITKTGKSASLGVLTTVASFYVLTINDFKGFSDFGWIAGNGLLIALFCYLFFFPPLILLAERYRLFKFKHVDYDSETHVYTKNTHMPYAKPILISLLVLAVFSAYELKNVQFEWNFSNLKMQVAERTALKEKLKSSNGRVNSPASYLVSNEIEARKLRQIIDERKQNDKEFATIDEFHSYYDIIPFGQEERMAVIKDIDSLLKDDALNALKDDEKKMVDNFRASIKNVSYVQEKDIPKEVKEIFWGNTGNTESSVAFVAPLPNLELDNGYNAEAFYKDVHEVDALGKKFYALSDSMVFAEVLKTLFHDSKIAISLSSLILIFLIWLDFRDFKRTAFIITGLACGVFGMFGVMNLFGMHLNFYNMIVIPAVIGMGEDNSVHIMNRFEELKRKSILGTLRSSGGASFMASLTTMLGYGGLCFTSHPGLNSIGWMAIVGVTTCLLGSLLVLPLLMQLFLKPEDYKGH